MSNRQEFFQKYSHLVPGMRGMMIRKMNDVCLDAKTGERLHLTLPDLRNSFSLDNKKMIIERDFGKLIIYTCSEDKFWKAFNEREKHKCPVHKFPCRLYTLYETSLQ